MSLSTVLPSDHDPSHLLAFFPGGMADAKLLFVNPALYEYIDADLFCSKQA